MWEAINTIGLVILGMIAIYNRKDNKEIKIMINSRLTQLLELTAKSSKAEGVEQQRRNGVNSSPEQ